MSLTGAYRILTRLLSCTSTSFSAREGPLIFNKIEGYLALALEADVHEPSLSPIRAEAST